MRSTSNYPLSWNCPKNIQISMDKQMWMAYYTIKLKLYWFSIIGDFCLCD